MHHLSPAPRHADTQPELLSTDPGSGIDAAPAFVFAQNLGSARGKNKDFTPSEKSRRARASATK
jgi:hypothetical protein